MKVKYLLLCSYLTAVVLYAAFTLLPVPSRALLVQYHLTPTGLRTIDITIIILQAIIWLAGFYGFSRLHEYTQHIRHEKDGKEVIRLKNGILLLVLWLPVTAVVSTILAFIGAHHPGLLPAFRIIQNYLGLVIPLAGFILISRGARGLSDIAKQRPSYLATIILSIILIYTGLIYLNLVLSTSARSQVYHMPAWPIILTLVAPYIFMWFTGMLAAYQIYIYRQRIAGIVYRKSWGLLALGLGWMIFTSIAVQYLTTLTPRLMHLTIYQLLFVVYVLLLVYAGGFVLIALGARKLQKIEEV